MSAWSSSEEPLANRNGKAKSEFAKPLSGFNPGSNPENSMDTTAIRCDFLQEQYELSDREAKVLLLTARGRDAPCIAEALYISVNTVRNYIGYNLANVSIPKAPTHARH